MKSFSLNIRGNLVTVSRPLVMGILNATPDSFYTRSRCISPDDIASRTHQLIDEGADIIDLGGYSSRPGAADITPEEELRRLTAALQIIRRISHDIIISVDTFRSNVARTCVKEYGADIINDISGGSLDDDMLATVAELKTPYIAMHMRGNPATMQRHTTYNDVTADVIAELSALTTRTEALGINDVIIDPGFGFGKTVEQNYHLLDNLPVIENILQRPILVGISRKSMLYRPLGITADDALNATTVANTVALMRGAAILRVHDVAAARQAIEITGLLPSQSLQPDKK